MCLTNLYHIDTMHAFLVFRGKMLGWMQLCYFDPIGTFYLAEVSMKGRTVTALRFALQECTWINLEFIPTLFPSPLVEPYGED